MNTETFRIKTDRADHVSRVLEKYATTINALAHSRWFGNTTASFVRQEMTYDLNHESCITQFGLVNVYSSRIVRFTVTAVINFDSKDGEFIATQFHRQATSACEDVPMTGVYAAMPSFDLVWQDKGKDTQHIHLSPKINILYDEDGAEYGTIFGQVLKLSPVGKNPEWWFLHREPGD